MKIVKKRGVVTNARLTAMCIVGLFLLGNSTLLAYDTGSDTADRVSEHQQQTLFVTGIVVDNSGDPVIGASVVEKGTPNGTITDINGRFTLNVRQGVTLLISFIGYQTQEVRATPNISITLKEDSELLDEVVVVGYGTQRRANLTGAVSTVDVNKALSGRPIADIGRGLQGTTPGLSIVIPSGEVGSDPTIRIRGQVGSKEGENAPLILLDNVEIPSILMVNPDDVESISILKDAASASIYGAKAAFGVVLITTKQGAKTETIHVSYQGSVSWQNPFKRYNMATVDGLGYSIDAAERVGETKTGAFWLVTRESYERAVEWQKTYGKTVKAKDPMLYGRDWYVDAEGSKLGLRTYDPYDYMVREWAPSTNHNLSVNGKSGKTSYNIGLGYVDQSGMMKTAKHDDFKRYNASVRLSTEFNKYVTLRAGAIYSKRNKRYAYSTNSTTADPWLYLYRWSSIYPMTTEDGDPIRSPAYETAAANTANQENSYTSLNVGFTLNLTDNWKVNFDYTHSNEEYIKNHPGTRFTARNSWVSPVEKYDSNGNRIYVNSAGEQVSADTAGAMAAYELSYDAYTSAGANPDHIYRETSNAQRNTINMNTTYDLNIGRDNIFKFMLGMNSVTYDYEQSWSQITNLFDITNPQFSMADGTQTSGGESDWDGQLGFFGRVNYAFKDRYLFEANLRYDGTSKFPSDLRWRWFPSFSAGWRMSEEAWMEWAKPVVSSFKLRGSWGIIGDQTVPNSLYVPILEQSITDWIMDGAKLISYGTPAAVASDVTWQDVQTLNLGLDARFFQGDLGISFDWYQRYTKNMIVPFEGTTETFGTTAPKGNYGALRTRGWKIALDYNYRFSNGVGINAMVTLSDAITKVTKWGSNRSIDSWYTGMTYGEIWGYETDRLYQKDDFVYDSNGDLILIEKSGYSVYQLSDPNGAYQGRLQTSSDFKFGPGDVKFVDRDGDGEITPGARTVEDHGDLKVIGNSTPRYEYGFRLGADYKGFDVSVFFQGVGKRQIWGSGQLAIPGYNAADGAMPQVIAGNYWREDRTDAFYPRAYNNAGSDDANNMHQQSRYLLDMSYLRIKNITVGYTLPATLSRKAWIQRARVYAALENFFTFDNLRGLPVDPEEVSGYSMFNTTNYNAGRTGVGTPTFKSASLGI